MRFDDCYKIINRRIFDIQEEIQKRHRQGLQVRPLRHRLEELERVRREIARLATPKEFAERES
jgi:BMFP domain-containing protein YqiC